MKLLVIGASGYSGGRLARVALSAGWRVVGTYWSSGPGPAGVEWRRLDVTDAAAVSALVSTVEPTAVVNAAYAAPDWAVTADGAAHVAVAARAAGSRLVHVSSDAIFAGRPSPYVEDDVPSPVYPYGAAKAAAELAVRAVDPGAAVVRTSLIVGDGDSKQHRLSLDLALGRARGVLFTDMVRCPIAVDDLASALLELVTLDYAGVLNVAGPDAVDRHEMGRRIARHHGVDPDLVPAGTMAVAGFRGPGDVRLDSSRAAAVLRTRLRGVNEFLPLA